MLYLNSIENVEASPTEKKYAICHEEVPSIEYPGISTIKTVAIPRDYGKNSMKNSWRR